MQRKFICTFILTLILQSALLPAFASGKEADIDYEYYTDIPGITDEDITAVEAMKAKFPGGLKYGMLYSNEAFLTEKGQVGGYSHLICLWLSRLFGMTVTPQIMEWDELVEGLNDLTVDLSGELTATEERRQSYFMTSSIAERTLVMFRNKNREPLDLITGEQSFRFGFLKGTVTYDRVLDTSEVSFTPVFVQNYQEAAQALEIGTIDAFINEAMMDSAFENYPDIAYQEYYPVTFSTTSLTTANPELEPMIDVVQKYLDLGGTHYLSSLYAQGKREYLSHKLYGQLTDEEKRYIQYHVENDIPVPLAPEFDNYPISFYNKQEKQWQGITHDILKEVEDLTGLKFESISGENEEWSSILNKLSSGEASIITNLMKSKDRQGHFLWPDNPYMTDYYALLSRTDTEDMSINQVFRAKVGLIDGSAYEEIFHRVFPNHPDTVVYDNTIDCFEALKAGEIDLGMMNQSLLSSITNYSEQSGFKVNVFLNIPCEAYFGFNKDQSALCSIVSKAQDIVDCGVIVNRWNKRVFDYEKKLAQERLPYLIGISALLFTVLVLVIILYKKRERKTLLIGMTDYLTRLPNRRCFEQRLNQEWKQAVSSRLYISLLTIDVDKFKKYNDTYGHPQGDELLRFIAALFTDALMRPEDMAARTGGEEFAVLLPNTDLSGAFVVAEKIRKSVEESVIETIADGRPTGVTVSIGIACVNPGPDDSLADFISCSDKALYKAKKEGRNRVSSC